MDLNLIENSQKKKKNKKNLMQTSKTLFESIDTIIDLDIKKNKKNEDSLLYVKESLKDFIELYININRNIKNINNKNLIVKQIIDDMLKKVFLRCEPINEPELNCIISNYKEEKNKKETIKIIMND